MATEPLSCFAVAAPGLEWIVARELKALGERPRPEEGGVAWTGDARSLMRANLWLRTATRVLVRVASFDARTFAELERHAKRVDWGRYLAPGATAEFRITSRKSKLLHTGAISERLLSALGSRLSAPAVESREPKAEGQLFVVRALRDEFEISADSSGELLHMRGYRQAVAKAPLRETLAAALLLAAEWDPATPLLDPFCGSGTIAIEAAMLARRIAPGAGRPFAFSDWPRHDAAAWRALVEAARAGVLPKAPAPIVGSDRDAGAVRMAGENAARAGVANDVSFERVAISDVSARAGDGLVATNPPYGKRAGGGADGDIRNLYARFGQVCRERLPAWRVALYAPNLRLARETRIPFVESFRTSNGGIRVVALRSS